MTHGWSRGDLFFVGVIAVVFLVAVVVPTVRRRTDDELLDPSVAPSGLLRRWRRPPDS